MSKKDCCCCENDISFSNERFEVEFTNDEKLVYCVYCLTETIANIPDEIKVIRNIGKYQK